MVEKNRNRIRTSRRLIPLLVAGLLASAPLLGTTQTALTPGDLHLLKVQEVRSVRHHAPTSLEWSLVGKGGREIGGVIPGTDGPEFDAYPSLFNDADTGAPILVWSRHNGVDYDVALTRFDGESWTTPITLVGTDRDEIQPRAFSTSNGAFHLVWNWPADDGSFLYGQFRVDSGIPLLESERVLSAEASKLDRKGVSTKPEGGLDDPGSGRSGSDDKFNCEQDERCPCDFGGQCAGTSPSVEGATVCESLSLVVGSGPNACILTRTPDGWSTGTCQAFRGGAGARELLLSLGRLQNTGCP